MCCLRLAYRSFQGREGRSKVQRAVGDTDTIRRQNRGLVLDALRRLGPLSRTALAEATGLSNATITAITADLKSQSILIELDESQPDQKTRGRPAVRVDFNREAGYMLLLEIDVTRARCSLVDYSGTMVDRLELPVTGDTFEQTDPADFIAERIGQIQARNPETDGLIRRVAVSVQGVLERDGSGLQWSPIAGFAGTNLVDEIGHRLDLPLKLHKRGPLLAEGTRWLFPDLRTANVATVFIGSTVALGISFHNRSTPRDEDTPTEFGHMIHIPGGALCRCGTPGCVEAYAADYGVLRTAYGVPDRTPPAPAVPPHQYAELIGHARRGDRNAVHAFNVAGSAIGYGLNRLMTVFDPSHVVIAGPGAEALPLMWEEMQSALSASLIARVRGVPEVIARNDENEPVFKGLTMKTLNEVDQEETAMLPTVANRVRA